MVEFADKLLLSTLFLSNRLATAVKITHNVKGLAYFSFSLACQTVTGIPVKTKDTTWTVEFANNLLLPTLFLSNRLATSVKITHK